MRAAQDLGGFVVHNDKNWCRVDAFEVESFVYSC